VKSISAALLDVLPDADLTFVDQLQQIVDIANVLRLVPALDERDALTVRTSDIQRSGVNAEVAERILLALAHGNADTTAADDLGIGAHVGILCLWG
jgi:hypothetical protein